MVAAHFVQIPACGRNFDRPQSLVPAFPYHPFRRTGGFDLGVQPLAELIKSLRADQVDVHLLQTGARQVHVGVIESGHHEVTIQVDDLRLRSLQLHDLVTRPHGEDPVAKDRQRFRALARSQRSRRIDHSGKDVSVDKDQVRFRLLRARLGALG